MVWKSFQLDPQAQSTLAGERHRPDEYAERLAAKYATSVGSAQRMIGSMTATAAADGLEFRFDRAVRANTFDAHQVLHLARLHGRQDEMKERLLRGYLSEGLAMGDREVLVDLASAAGLPAAEVRTAQAAIVVRVLPAVRDIRRTGSAALDLAWVAAGRLDAYYEHGVKPWDIAAGVLLCEGAGLHVEPLAEGGGLPQGLLAAPAALADGLRALVGP